MYGDFRLINEDDDNFFAYERTYNGETFIIVCNFTAESQSFKEIRAKDSELIIGSYDGINVLEDSILMRPYEAVILRVNNNS